MDGNALSMNVEGVYLYKNLAAKAAIIDSPISKKVSFDLCPSKISPIKSTESTKIIVNSMFLSLVTLQYNTM